jgi:hypothetical protein
MKPIPETRTLTPREFDEEILPAGQPVVLRGFVRDWPIVEASQDSAEAFCDYVKRFDRGHKVDVVHGPASMRGRVFYNEDMTGLNCRMESTDLSSSLDFMLAHRNDNPAPTTAVQSVTIPHHVPGLDRDNPLPPGYVPEGIEPRLWIGSRTTVAAHFDPSENIACCVAGTRRFTLLPPEQVTNLYIGPFELTPAGAIISMVDFDAPDYDAFPRFREAEQAMLVTDLEPGDAIYVPYLWWHHVRALDAINGLVNYWWAQPEELRGDPRNAMFHALLSLASLPDPHRKAWRAMFDHYVFGDREQAADHLPANRRGILGELRDEDLRRLRLALSRALSRS